MERTVNILIVGRRNLLGKIEERTAGTGNRVRIATDHREAAEAIQTHPTDMLIMEIGSPQAAGLLKYVNDNDNFNDIRVVLTADNETGEVIRALRYGKYKFISDPFMLPELRDARIANCNGASGRFC